MKPILLGLALVLAACSSNPLTKAIPLATATTSASGSAMYDAMDMALETSAVPNGTVAIRSIAVEGTINGQTGRAYFNGICHETGLRKGAVAHGTCGLYAKKPLHIAKLIAGLFTGSNATGCLAAAGAYKGYVPPGDAIPITWYWTGKC